MKDSKDKIYSFKDSNRIGKLGEQEVLGYLEKILPNLNKIENVTLNKEYQKKDIDAILHFINGEKISIEVKTDTHEEPKYFAYEAWSSLEDSTPGCMVACEADLLFYFFCKTGELFQIKLQDYKQWVEKNKFNFREILVKNSSWTKEYNSVVYLIPKEMLKASFKSVVIYNVKHL